uniref:Secreted protein acidic and cysteine rich n=1 Tax=Podarcis muralis TaxID=64176 RepID=A0A670IGM5_PODMU
MCIPPEAQWKRATIPDRRSVPFFGQGRGLTDSQSLDSIPPPPSPKLRRAQKVAEQKAQRIQDFKQRCGPGFSSSSAWQARPWQHRNLWVSTPFRWRLESLKSPLWMWRRLLLKILARTITASTAKSVNWTKTTPLCVCARILPAAQPALRCLRRYVELTTRPMTPLATSLPPNALWREPRKDTSSTWTTLDLANVKKIHENEKRLEAGDHTVELLTRDFEKNYNMYIFPVHWQFGQLDQHPVDGYLSHTELAPLRAPLIPMEHCTTRFFETCDLDNDKYIALEEWGNCFGIKEKDIDKDLVI